MNALNSILSYVQRPSSIKTLESLGIEVFADKARTQFRNVMDIFQDIASKWPTLSADIQDAFVKAADDAGLYNEELANAIGVQQQWNDLQQRDISQAAAGVYRRNYFIAMIERLTQAQEVLNNMMDAAGYSQAENARTMDTLEKKYNSLKAAVQQLAVALGDAGLLDILKGLTGTATDVAGAFAKMDDNTKALVLTVLELLAALGTLKATLGLFTTKGILDVAGLLPGWGKLIAIIAAATSAIGLYLYNMKKANAETLQDSVNSINAKRQELEQANNLINSYEILQGKVGQSNQVKTQMLDIQKQLATLYPEYVDAIDDEGNKLITNIPLLKQVIALKQKDIELDRLKLINESKASLSQLENQKRQLENKIKENQQKLASGDTTERRRFYGDVFEFDITSQIRNELEKQFQQLSDITLEINAKKQLINQSSTSAQEQEILKKSMRTSTAARTTTGRTATGGAGAYTGTGGAGVNEALQNALRVLEYKRHLNLISIEEEIAYLKQIKSLYAKSADERMDLDERIYDAEKELKDKRLQDSINWINEKKALDQLSTEQEIAAWERVLKNQSNNIEAVKEATINLHKLRKQLADENLQNSINWINEKKALDQLSAEEEIAAWERVLKNQSNNIEAVKEATVNLYKLRKQLAEDVYSDEENRIQHLAKLGLYTIQQQIDAYRELYSTKASSIEDEYKRTENLFDLYKDLLNEQQQAIKDAYDERIQQIEEEAEKKKKAQQEIIDGIEEELELLDREESEYDYEQKMADLKEQLAYWSVRTSEEARQKVADINKQIDEAEHDREVELQREKLEDKKKAAEDEIDAIEEAANEEKEKWEKSYELVEKAFDEHSINMIAMAATMSKEAYQQWVDNYLIPLQNALKENDLEDFEDIAEDMGSSAPTVSNNARIYELANDILDLKRQYEYEDDKSAEQRAIQYYNELEQLAPTVADALHSMNYKQAKSYVASLPRAHIGARVLTYGAAFLKPGELIFPPDLSKKLENLISALYARPVQQTETNKIDNSKKVQINTLLNIENNHMEDEVDAQILSRELRRAVLAL